MPAHRASTVSLPSSQIARDRLRPTVVHIGPGVFHRAHQAVYSDRLLRAGSTDGAIWAISLRSSEARDALAPDDYRYPLIERSHDADPPETVRSIDAILGITVATENVAALTRLIDPDVTVVTITVTEKGYCAVEPGGALDMSRPEVVLDLATPTSPRSLPGLLVEALHQRRMAGIAPFTIVSCDNLPTNGRAVARVVTEFAEARSAQLGTWVAEHVAFPSSMVDRMVPATTNDDRAWCRAHGLSDAWPVVSEPFSQWVLEDTFTTSRPDWGAVGVELVSDVSSHERAKLRILNAAHSALAYWGLLAGHDFIWQAVDDPILLAATAELVHDEVIPTLEPPPGWDLADYADQVIKRFGNQALPYTTRKVAGDGSQKLPVRLIPTVVDLMAARRPAPRSGQVLAAWLVTMFGPSSSTFAVTDPSLANGPGADLVRRARHGAATAEEAVAVLPTLPGFSVDGPAWSATVADSARRIWHTDDIHHLLTARNEAPHV